MPSRAEGGDGRHQYTVGSLVRRAVRHHNHERAACADRGVSEFGSEREEVAGSLVNAVVAKLHFDSDPTSVGCLDEWVIGSRVLELDQARAAVTSPGAAAFLTNL